MWPFSIYTLLYPQEKYIWAQIRILHETDKAMLVDAGIKTWIPKSKIRGIRLRKSVFEIYVKESTDSRIEYLWSHTNFLKNGLWGEKWSQLSVVSPYFPMKIKYPQKRACRVAGTGGNQR